jgi:biotin operon repressor
MTVRMKATALLATGALAGGAATVITQAGADSPPKGGDGPSTGQREQWRQRGEDRLAALAKDLGVSSATLRTAFGKVRDQLREDRPEKGEPGADLAKALGVSGDDLRTALRALRQDDSLRPKRGDRTRKPTEADRAKLRDAFAAALAKKLGIDQAKVTAAFAQLEKDHQAQRATRRSALAAALAKQLGKSTADVEKALAANLPEGRGGFGGPGVGPGGGHRGGPGRHGFGPGGPGGPRGGGDGPAGYGS